MPRGPRPTSVNTPSDTICVFIMLLFTIRYYTNIINVQPTAFNFPLYFVFCVLFFIAFNIPKKKKFP